MRVGLALLTTFLLPIIAFAALININTADATLLDSLPDIGPSKAKAIVDYRTQHGPFARIEDIQNVTGIGPATFDKLKPLITVSDSGAPAPADATTTPPAEPVVASGASSYVPPPSALSLTLSGAQSAFANVPLHLSARATLKNGSVDSTANIAWSFGDGSTQSGTQVEKTYQYLGTYVVTVKATDGSAVDQDEVVVTVVPAQVRVTSTGEGITVLNDAGMRLDLSGWRILADGWSFRIPDGTIVLPNMSVLLPSAVTNLPTRADVTLVFPNGSPAARSGAPAPSEAPLAVSYTAPVQPSPAVARSYSVQASQTIISAPPSTQNHVDAVLAPTAATNIAAVGAPLPSVPDTASKHAASLLSPWILGLAGVIVLAGGAFILL